MLHLRMRKDLGPFSLDVAIDSAETGVTALFGRSGAGKTTLINIIAGLVRPDEGRIEVDGHILEDSQRGFWMPPEKRRIGYVFQEHRLFPHMTVRANLSYGMKRASRTDDGQPPFEQVVRMLDIAPMLARMPNQLSGGERQRVAIGRALLSSPRILLMDEPLASLDAPRKAEIIPFIERIREDLEIPIIYVSHHMDEIISLADDLILLSEGRCIAHGPIEQLTARLDLLPYTGRFEAGAVINARVRHHEPENGVSHLGFDGGEFIIPLMEDPVGTELRFRVRARDVSLALTPPENTSVLNILPGTIDGMADDGHSRVEVRLRLGDPPGETLLLARVTRKAAADLKLRPGLKIYALIKAMSANRRALGRGGAAR